ncbi:hypothetical protein Back11_49690 [Paenibacillus baekrokdamisoli]|uniref:Uncharacterized protein n=1 Tax=Paenibacillus baekrokdamisoli TaxID=1712516 RepID=A0A3G9JL38_9BACL|nr:hypothetical protein [Paenibacillus baekrokdamisoli]MBB3068798.1 hypothetical protein [Paenibacillus baekrokdamisoli]BBH23624.1 hypothetical protein Back11_49690 [Paenibacillus baekrokdamisoli]
MATEKMTVVHSREQVDEGMVFQIAANDFLTKPLPRRTFMRSSFMAMMMLVLGPYLYRLLIKELGADWGSKKIAWNEPDYGPSATQEKIDPSMNGRPSLMNLQGIAVPSLTGNGKRLYKGKLG